ncbi:MAG: hypothetical protein CMN57_05615 [Gammaproteobacteria bacterium]|nr:hypothetical protein [Gammaproteobacteria bacterium]
MNNNSRALLKRIRTSVFTAAAILVAGAIGFAAPAAASTPDGETPANEGVCDELMGATPGLYGLCVAYCEAQDLDTVDKQPPNTKILDNYRKKMKAGDPDMPCIQAPCPCWSSEELAVITSDGIAASCLRNSGRIQLIDSAPATRYAFADTESTRCAYVDINTVPPKVRNQTITAEEAQSCMAALTQACDALGL